MSEGRQAWSLARGADCDVTAAQVDALRSVLEAVRMRVEERCVVADRFASQAEKLAEAAEARPGWWSWRRRT